ncbi:mucin-5AC [Artibeus jamaicensis]|uniref:mucin-5AC n=1 Tax=Artibeus jamaicensis TaxID=9417 RepID=UPI00235B2978|nr:mucin-5AC [Artibeus jamaicensis]
MGVGRREVAALWALALALACAQHAGDPLLGVTILPPLKTTAVVRALNPAHNGRVCSTWGDFHYKTFDGDIFRFPGRCNYVFSAHCGAAYEDFNVQLRRGQESNATTLSKVTMKLNGMVLELTKGSVLVDGRLTQLPFSRAGVLIERGVSSLKVAARLGLVFMWNQDDSLLLELDPKYANQTCGLCGDFNGAPVFNEFLSRGVRLSPVEFGRLQKMDGPTEQCQDPDPGPTPVTGCSTDSGLCQEVLLGEQFQGCRPLVDASSYVQACQQDLCLCGEAANLTGCACHTIAEYSRQCAHAGGLPLDWRGPGLCPETCPLDMQYRECGSPCTDTCSNLEHSQACEDHCVAGCFCPEGMVLDDIGQKGCVPASQCPCVHNGATYATGASYSTECSTCTCSGGRWSCQEVACPGTCSVLGGAHFSTFDEKPYTVHGDCSYVLAKPCNGSAFTVLAELRRCGLTDSESCLRSLTLSLGGGRTVVTVQAGGEVFVDQVYAQLPISAANITVFRPSTFFIIAQTNLGLQVDVQLVPTMQVFLRLAPELRGLTCGLCGNFNQNQADDFRTLSGVVEGTAAAFANTWKTQAACPNVRNSFEDPCALSVENEKYAQHWCSRLTDPQGPFVQCHAAVSPGPYYSHCLFDTCNCENSEDCLCAALSSYVRACAARGVVLRGWRAGVCAKPTENCPKSMTYRDHISTCQPTCRALSNKDPTCGISFVPVDGCTCPQGTFLDDTGKCVPAASCPCYHGALVIPSGESVHQQGAVCTCTKGTLTCIGGHTPDPACAPPMVYADCRNASAGAAGAGCQKSCHTLDMDCYSPQCLPGCVCPDGLVADGEGGCIAAADCPCVHNEASYRAGQTIRVGCNTCTCQSRMWKCTDEPCMATCAVYGDGHYLTFDGQRYSFSGNCEYTLVQDHCGGNGSSQDALRVVTENVPCGTTGTTCSKAIKIFLGSYELKLSDGKVEVLQKAAGQEAPYTIRQVGIYLVVDTEPGLVLLWDKKTSIFLRLSPEFKGRVCGLCGNFDDNALNDFTTRSQSVAGDALEFGNSWKFSPSCPDAPAPRDPCTANPYRKSWAQKQCSLLHGATFQACHAHVDPTKYYEACVSDACACDSGGDCECFCTAVAAYAQACGEAGVCVAWRTPDVCPLFCDYYNPEGQCEWHYQPCGAPCLRTCRNPRGQCPHDTQGLEGCYPRCPEEAPIFDEDDMQCVAACPSPPPPPPCQVQGKSYRLGAAVPSDKNCYSCTCTESGVQCTYDADACVCTYGGRRFRPGDIIYHTTDGTGGCISARCGASGSIERRVRACGPSTPAPSTTFSFSTPPIAASSTGRSSTLPSAATSPAPTGTVSRAPPTAAGTPSRPQPSTASIGPHPGCGEDCRWSPWLDISRPGRGIDSGDFDTLDNLRAHGHPVCRAPRAVECRAEDAPELPPQDLGRVECSPTVGLACYNRDQASGLCDNYQIRVLCCTPRACPTSSGAAPTAPRTTRSTTPGATSLQTGGTAPVHTAGPSASASTRRSPAPGTPTPGGTSPGAPGTVPVSTTAGTATSGASTAPGPSTGPSQTPCAQEFCSWTAWIDSSYPAASIDSGDFDTFQNLRSKGYKFCERPSQVACRAVSFPNTPLAELGQNVICNNSVGLVCRNRDQLPPICYNYEVRIQCCAWVDVCTDRTPTGTPEATRSSTQEAMTRPKTALTVGTQVASTQHRSDSSVHVTRGATVTAGTHLTYAGTTSCQPQCTWTKWFDVDFPSPGPHGGDLETYSNIVRSGEKICRRPEYITHLQCRAENHPELSIDRVGQVVQCNPDVGLVCRNRDQRGPFKVCLNYEVRVLCCEPREGCPTYQPVTVASTQSVRVTSTAETTSYVVTTRKTSLPGTSSAPVPGTSTTPVPRTSETPVPGTSTTPVPGTSETPRDTCARNQHDTCAGNQHDPCAGNQHDPCAGNQRDTCAGNQRDPCARNQRDPCARNQRDTCARNQHDPCAGNQLDPCAGNQHDTCAGNQHDPCARNQRDTCAGNQHDTCAGNQLDPCAGNQRDTCARNQHDPCARNQHDTCAGNQLDPCAGNQRDTCAGNQHDPCAGNQQDPCAGNQQDPCAGNQRDPCARNQRDTCAGNQRDTCAGNQRDTCAGNQHDPCAGNHATPVPGTSATPVPGTSATPVPGTSVTPVPGTSTTPVPGTSTTPVPGTSTTPVPGTSTTPVPGTSSTPVPGTSVTPVPGTSTTPVPGTSTTPVPGTSSTPVPGTSVTPVPGTSSTPVPGTSVTPVPGTSTTPVPGTSVTPVPGTSTTPVPGTSSTPVPGTSSTPVPGTSATPVPGTSETPVPGTSTTPVPGTSETPVPGTSATPVPGTSATPVPGTSATPVPGTSTTPVPGTSTTPVPTPATTHSTPGTTSCQPQCTWTKWFDVDFPSPGPHGGDLETYSNIVRSGEKICRRPEYITHLQCRAENHPELSIDRVGQVVQCNPDVGLVCRNRDQRGPFKVCLNYEVRVLCCEPREGCLLSPATPGIPSSMTSPLTSEPTSWVPAVTTLSPSAPPTTKCYCSVSHQLYPAGSIIYQEADLAGHCYYAVCSLDCHVVRQTDHACPTSTVLPTPTPSMPGSSPSAPVPVTTQGCPSAVPPRMREETWAMPNCSQATCEGNNVITLQRRPCPQVQKPTCANGYPALKAADEDGCCQHYQCQCVCSGWGDPHYITFDGTYYTFLDNCTYVLVQQIVPVYGHFRVLIDNYFCHSEDGLSCPQSIIVEYRQDRVVLTRKPVRGVMTNEILFNNHVVRPGFAKDGIVVSQIGIKMYVSIPEVGVQVMFSGLIFSVDVPFSKFANNTEGQCGTCTNDRKDECRLPGGAVVASCSDMSRYWKVTNPDQPTCHGPPATPPKGGPMTLPTSCPPPPICQLILSDTFKPCHTTIPPRPYYEGCVFDWCHMPEPDAACSGLELYASLCAAQGLCIDWRGRTNHTCPFTCPADKEYRPCSPSNPSYCYGGNSTSVVALKDISPITEGCFCPEDMMLFSASTEVCVPAGCPRCLGPHGEPVEPGHTVTFDCQECTCEGTTWTMSCRRQPCPLPPACPEPGFVPVPVAPQAGQCCPQYTCACNASYCPALSGCPEGSLQTVNYEEGACCPSQKCGWTVCSVNGTLYQPGAVVSSSLCQKCRCEVPGRPHAVAFRISCETETCSTHCPAGFEYQAQSGRCCGSCVQVACVMNASDGSAHLFQPGESWSDPGDRCVTHQCEKHQDGLVVVTVKKTCPSLTCPRDQAGLSEDGCCLFCPAPETQNRSTCDIYHKLEVIRVQGCSSAGPVPLAYCKGNCGDTASVFSLAAGELQHNCRCCRELRATPRNVTLSCADGSRRAFSYTQVEECGCAGLQCDTRSGLDQGLEEGPLRSQNAARGGWSRGAPATPAA